MTKISAVIAPVALIVLIGVLIYIFSSRPPTSRPASIPITVPATTAPVIAPSSPPPAAAPPSSAPLRLANPLSNARVRVTKKPFGLKVSPGHSPVTPERFSGYHTGADFETTPAEQAVDVPVFAVCDGSLALKEYASGYGGVAVERCIINGNPVTIIYGHLRLASIAAKTGATLQAGEQLAVLGTGYSQETDGERKHLHLGLHRGSSINIKGYVATAAELSAWIDPLTLLP